MKDSVVSEVKAAVLQFNQLEFSASGAYFSAAA
jgi:hypothetical protein